MFITIYRDRRSPYRGRNNPISRVIITSVTRDDTVSHRASRDTVTIQAVCRNLIFRKNHIKVRIVAGRYANNTNEQKKQPRRAEQSSGLFARQTRSDERAKQRAKRLYANLGGRLNKSPSTRQSPAPNKKFRPL